MFISHMNMPHVYPMDVSRQTQQGSRQQSEELKSTQCFMSVRSKEGTS